MAGAQQAKSQSCTTLKKTPLVYMASQTALICKCYAAECTKTRAKILQPENSKKEKNAPEIVRKRRNRVRFGCWRGWERLWAGANGWESLAIGQKDLSRLPARAVRGTRFWSGCGRAQPGAEKGSVSPGSRRKPQKGRCWFGAASYFWRRIVYRLPLLPSKEKHLRQKDGQADQDHGRVGPGSVQLRHRVEIHAVPTSN